MDVHNIIGFYFWQEGRNQKVGLNQFVLQL